MSPSQPRPSRADRTLADRRFVDIVIRKLVAVVVEGRRRTSTICGRNSSTVCAGRAEFPRTRMLDRDNQYSLP